MENINEKLAKIYALVEQGGTEGEKKAAREALDRIMKRYNLNEEDMKELGKHEYRFGYSTKLELWLLSRIMRVFVEGSFESSAKDSGNRNIISKIKYIDFVTIDCMYAYFRVHMKGQWVLHVKPLLKKCRKPKTRARRRSKLNLLFFNQYVMKSKLYKEEERVQVEVSGKEADDRIAMMAVEGGIYNRQVVGGLMIEEKAGQTELFN